MRFNRFICIKTVIGSLYPLAFLAQENLTTHGDPLLSNCFINFAIKMQEMADNFVMSNDNNSLSSMITLYIKKCLQCKLKAAGRTLT